MLGQVERTKADVGHLVARSRAMIFAAGRLLRETDRLLRRLARNVGRPRTVRSPSNPGTVSAKCISTTGVMPIGQIDTLTAFAPDIAAAVRR